MNLIKKSIGLEGYSYFNAGILLINLNKWKEENSFPKINKLDE